MSSGQSCNLILSYLKVSYLIYAHYCCHHGTHLKGDRGSQQGKHQDRNRRSGGKSNFVWDGLASALKLS